MSEPASIFSGQPLVLIVDDELGLLQLFKTLLTRLPCAVFTALGGAEAIDLLDRYTPDLLVLDLAMPVVSGVEVLEHVRATPRLNAMTVMILTARPTMVPEVEALGIDLWVSKPILPHDLLKLVESVLAEKRSSA